MHWREKAGVFCGFTILPSEKNRRIGIIGKIGESELSIPIPGRLESNSDSDFNWKISSRFNSDSDSMQLSKGSISIPIAIPESESELSHLWFLVVIKWQDRWRKYDIWLAGFFYTAPASRALQGVFLYCVTVCSVHRANLLEHSIICAKIALNYLELLERCSPYI